MILFNSVLENNYKIKIIFLIKFQEKWKKYLEIHNKDMGKAKLFNNNSIKNNSHQYKAKKNKNWGVKILIM